MFYTLFTILLATVVQFICGALWYSILFGKLWGQMHGFDKLSKKVQQEMMSQMGPFYGLQFLVTLLSTIVLAVLISNVTSQLSVFMLAALLWLGFIVPAQVGAVIFGGTESKWVTTKIAIQAGSSLLCLEAAAVVFYFL